MNKIFLSVSLLSLCFSMIGCSILFPDAAEGSNLEESALITESNHKQISTETTKPTTNGQQNLPTPDHSDEKSIDLYIIAGQFNAAGYTTIDHELLASLWSDYKVGSPNVLYRGVAEFTLNSGTSNVQSAANNVSQWTNAKAGQGRSTAHMGAEVGMAARLSQTYYTGNKIAGIIKYAHGGTSLLNKTTGENAANGNWVSPSYAKQMNLSYSGLTGNLYRCLLTTVSQSVDQLKSHGYKDIHIKGIFWMQGEADISDPTGYKDALKLFVADIRNDLAEITEDNPDDIAFMIGEISKTYDSALNSYYNGVFITMQRQVAKEMTNVYAIASSQYKINRLDSTGVDKYGQDPWHWTTEPMFRIGELVAQCILDNVIGYQE